MCLAAGHQSCSSGFNSGDSSVYSFFCGKVFYLMDEGKVVDVRSLLRRLNWEVLLTPSREKRPCRGF